jgi:hypothetical protein
LTVTRPTHTSWGIEFFQRHPSEDPAGAIPGLVFLNSCPLKVRAKFDATLTAVADAPPPAFSGGGYWEAMHDEMAGFYEIRIDGPKRPSDKGGAPRHYRLFCVLERDGAKVGLAGPSLVVIAGLDKAYRTVLSASDYTGVRALGDEYRSRTPRSVER